MSEKVELIPVDGVEVTVVMDNAIDILAASSETAFRPAWQWDWSDAKSGRSWPGPEGLSSRGVVSRTR